MLESKRFLATLEKTTGVGIEFNIIKINNNNLNLIQFLCLQIN